MNKLVVLGSVNADHVLQVPSFPRPGETYTGAIIKSFRAEKGKPSGCRRAYASGCRFHCLCWR